MYAESQRATRQLTAADWQRLAASLAQHEAVVAAWIYGSGQDGMVGPCSDIDVGVLFAERPTLELLAAVRAAVQAALDYDDVDLVPLNDASPMLSFAAVCGRPVFTADKEKAATFVSLTAREYEDEMAQWRRALGFRA